MADEQSMQWLKDKTDDQLLDMCYRIDGVKASAAAAELSRRLKQSIGELNHSVKALDEATGRYSRWMIVLTIVIIVMTAMQIYLAFR